MDLKWDVELGPDQRACPVVYACTIPLPSSVLYPSDDELEQIFKTKAFVLQTWARSTDAEGKTILTDDPHWIAVRGSTPLHFDPKYPRYSHHLKVRVDPNIVCRGLDKRELPLSRGLFYCLDTHSPHQVLSKDKGIRWNVACSIDSHAVIQPETILARMIGWASVPSILSR